MTGLSPDQLAREVRDMLVELGCVDEDTFAALAVLQVQAEAGQRLVASISRHQDHLDGGQDMQRADAALYADRAVAASSFPPVPGETT